MYDDVQFVFNLGLDFQYVIWMATKLYAYFDEVFGFSLAAPRLRVLGVHVRFCFL